MENNDLTFKTEQGKFNYRVGAIIIHDNKLLMVKSDKSPYYYSVGGRVKFNETTAEAVLRETSEETGTHFEIDRLGFTQENFFIDDVTKEVFHEIAFYYYMKDNGQVDFICNSFGELGEKEYLQWLPLDNLQEYNIYPEFFKTKLDKNSYNVEHIIQSQYDKRK